MTMIQGSIEEENIARDVPITLGRRLYRINDHEHWDRCDQDSYVGGHKSGDTHKS